jgi:two-component system sensor histidine kinase VanS
MLSPLARITEATRRAASGDLSHRIALVHRKDEFRVLADAFDDMLERIENQVAEHRRFAANASHELRTPLAITKSLVEVAISDPDRDATKLLDRVQSVNGRAIDLVEALLLLSRAERRSFETEHVDVSLAVEEAIELLAPLAEQRSVALTATTDLATTTGSHALLQQLATNLIHNAIVHNVESSGFVRIATARAGEFATLVVENSGEQIEPVLIATLVEPFQRRSSRQYSEHGGVGLGLAIVASIVEAHDGQLELEPRRGGGLRVTVRLPVTSSAAQP